jgi:colanic acid/amylovoran biosynthesis glycosyltransferase
MTVADNILVYRDRIVPRSEVHFLRRLYLAFDQLQPVWIGRHRGDGLAELGHAPLFLGREGVLGAVDRVRFKHFGALPPLPDLGALKPKLVHAHFGRGGALALPIARALKLPLVVHFHGGDATKDKHYRRQLLPTIYQQRLAALKEEAALFICVSNFIREQLLTRGFPPEKLVVHRYGVELDVSVPEDPPGPSGQVLFAGRFVEKKGISYLLEAMRRLEAEPGELELVLVGDGPIAGELKRQASPLKRVSFAGWLPNAELRRRMHGALAVCVPSVHAEDGDAEGLPNVVIEAMAAGAPVIGSRHAGIGEAVVHEHTGLLVPPADADALAGALRRLRDEPRLRETLGAGARRVAVAEFDARLQSQRLQQKLLEIIAQA